MTDSNTNQKEVKSFWAKLAACQNDIGVIAKDAVNPHFKSRYVTLDAITKALLPVTTKYGLVVHQRVTKASGEPVLITTVTDVDSGEKIEDEYPLSWDGANPQKQGSAITYARRYALGCIFQIATEEDDDGNRFSKSRSAQSGYAAQSQQLATTGQIEAIRAEINRTHIDLKYLLARYRLGRLEDMSHTLAAKILTKFQKTPSWQPASENQIVEIKAQLERTGINVDDILKSYHINDLSELGQVKAQECLNKLAAKPAMSDAEGVDRLIDALNTDVMTPSEPSN